MLPIICVSNRTLTITTTIHTNQLHKEPREQYKKENQKTKKNRREITNNLTKSWHLLNVQLIVQQKHFKKKNAQKKILIKCVHKEKFTIFVIRGNISISAKM